MQPEQLQAVQHQQALSLLKALIQTRRPHLARTLSQDRGSKELPQQ